MAAATNVENLLQYKVRFSFITEQMLGFPSHPSHPHPSKSKISVSNFQVTCGTMFYVIDYFHLDT